MLLRGGMALCFLSLSLMQAHKTPSLHVQAHKNPSLHVQAHKNPSLHTRVLTPTAAAAAPARGTDRTAVRGSGTAVARRGAAHERRARATHATRAGDPLVQQLAHAWCTARREGYRKGVIHGSHLMANTHTAGTAPGIKSTAGGRCAGVLCMLTHTSRAVFAEAGSGQEQQLEHLEPEPCGHAAVALAPAGVWLLSPSGLKQGSRGRAEGRGRL